MADMIGMADMKRFEQLASAARGDRPPRVDVTEAVLREVEVMSPFVRRQTYVLCAMSAMSAAAAIVVAAITLNVYGQLTDPLVAVLVQSSRIMP